MKERLLKGVSVFVFGVLFISTCYFAWPKYQIIHVENKIYDTLTDIGIPKSQLVILDRIEYKDKIWNGDSIFTEEFTTKKDYKNWKKLVEKSGKYLSGEILDKSEQSLSLDKCELRYSIIYTPSNREVSIAQVYVGDSLIKGDKKGTAFAFQIN